MPNILKNKHAVLTKCVMCLGVAIAMSVLLVSFSAAEDAPAPEAEMLLAQNTSAPADPTGSLKNVIEENQKLADRNRELENQLQQMRADMDAEKSRMDEVKRDRDSLAADIEKVRGTNRKYASDIQKLQEEMTNLSSQSQVYEKKLKSMEEETSVRHQHASGMVDPVQKESSIGSDEVQQREMKTIDLLSRIDAFNEEDEQLRIDAAKAHYNMGNIYFQKGEYEVAAREYYQAVTLMPNDPDAHYNLAFVSGEYLRDYKTALEHYKMYLYLNPQAKDYEIVRGKVMDAELYIKNLIESPIEGENK